MALRAKLMRKTIKQILVGAIIFVFLTALFHLSMLIYVDACKKANMYRYQPSVIRHYKPKQSDWQKTEAKEGVPCRYELIVTNDGDKSLKLIISEKKPK